MEDYRIRTCHLELIAGSVMLMKADLQGRESLAAALGAEVGNGWPPDVWAEAREEFLSRLEGHPGLFGWLGWYWVLVEDKRTLIGIGGFTGAPFNGEAMIGYSVIEPYRRRGYGSEAVRALIDWAFAHPGVRRIVAETHANNKASIRLLEKCGFEYAGKGFENGTERYVLQREKNRMTI
ncbi:GNAT family N-acetyltransferase [Methanocella conradii]|uniref:GNAT family N-acetyltransferase n=1 Tax=Methanocella conradii TaxID=1175444 RepID=UPI00157CB847|nr:GNAT family N-acetyltransferase [Methanocella conradii]